MIKWLFLIFSTVSIAAITTQERAELISKNLLANKNPGFENGTAGWTASGGTFTATSTALIGTRSGDWDSSSASQTLTSSAITIPDGLKGANGVVQCKFKAASGTATHTIQAYDGTNILSSVTITSSTSFALKSSANFVYPTSGSIYLRVVSVASNEPEIYIDDCVIGEAQGVNITDVSQAEMYGKITVSGCASNWTRSSASYGTFGTIASCSYTAYGNASSPSTNIPAIKFNSLPPGNYYFVARSHFYKNVITSNSSIGFRFNDGTNTFGENLISIASSGGQTFGSNVISGSITYTTAQSSITIDIQGKTSVTASSTNVQIGDDNTDETNALVNDLEIEVYRFPLASQTSYKPDQAAWYVDANISGANFDLGTGDQASYVEMTNASMTLTNNSGGATAQIACASGTASTGTTCSVNESNGIAFTIPKAGVYEACASFGHYFGTGAGGNVVTTFQIVETTNTSSAVVQEGKTRTTSGTQNASLSLLHPFKSCGTFVFSSAGQKTLRLEYEQDNTATVSFNYLLADANSAIGQDDIHWTVRPWLNNEPAPLLVNSVLSNSSGVERIERARINCDAGSAITSQSGSWISSVGNINASGGCLITFVSGIFSGDPVCTFTKLTCAAGGGTDCFTVGSGVPSGTTMTTACRSDSGAACTSNDFDMICMGAK